MTRDTAKYRPLQRSKNKPHSLKWLSKNYLGVEIQTGEHAPVCLINIWRIFYTNIVFIIKDVDARTALLVYGKVKKEWELSLKKKKKKYVKKSKSIKIEKT